MVSALCPQLSALRECCPLRPARRWSAGCRSNAPAIALLKRRRREKLYNESCTAVMARRHIGELGPPRCRSEPALSAAARIRNLRPVKNGIQERRCTLCGHSTDDQVWRVTATSAGFRGTAIDTPRPATSRRRVGVLEQGNCGQLPHDSGKGSIIGPDLSISQAAGKCRTSWMRSKGRA